MVLQTSIANALDNAGNEAKLDRNVKKIFSHEAILAPFMRMCIPEFQDFSDEFIAINCFVEKPEISKYTVHQDEGGKPDGNRRITQMNSEDNASNEQVIHYDIRFTARVPEAEREIRVIINLEIQMDDDLRYQVVTRGLYYCARMISAQYGTVFTHSEYNRIQKVYSIWICPDSRTKQNAITDYTIQEKVRTGNNICEKSDYDKLQVIVITLGQEGTSSTDQLIKYLSLILSDEKPLDERKKQLEDEYRIPMTDEMKEEMSDVCNMGEAIKRKAEAEGRAEGEKRMSTLMAKLFSLNRMEDARRCTTDTEFREKLYREFQLA